MTTTLTKINAPFAKMSLFTGMDSFRFKMVSILFIIVLSATNLFSQTVQVNYTKQQLAYQQKMAPFVAPANCSKPYTIYAAQDFPIIEAPASSRLIAMDDHEHFDYEAIFHSSIQKGTQDAKADAGVSRMNRRNQKNKIAPKLNS